MCGGGGSSSPPPPDYTNQRNTLKTNTLEGYNQAATDYNAAADIYNQQVQGVRDAASNVGGVLSNSSITDLWDDPTTEANENLLTNAQFSGMSAGDRLAWAENTINAMAAPEKPVFAPLVYGSNAAMGGVAIGADEMPTLTDLNDFNSAELLNTIGGYQSDLQGLISDRATEEGIARGNYNQYQIDTANQDFDIAQLGIGDLQGINDQQRNLNTMLATIGTQGSVLQNQIDFDGDGTYGDELGQIQGQFTGWKAALQKLLNDRTTEEKRITTFGENLYNDLDSSNDTLSGLDFTNLTEIGALEQLIREKEREAGRFSSELDFDFSGQQSELNQLKNALAGLRGQMTAETGRVSDFVNDQNNAYASLYGNAMNQGIYSKAGIDALQTAYDKIGYDSTNFSGYGYDPSNVSGGFYKNLISPQIQSLLDTRKTTLDNIESGIAGSTSGLDSMNLYDEAGIRGLYGDVTAAGSRLAPFSGGRVDGIQAQINTANSQIDAKLNELSAYRNKLEEDAQAFLEEIQAGSYYSLSDLDSPDTRAKIMDAEIKQYQAKQAMDEIEIVMEQLLSQKQRLELDAANVAARTADAQSGLNLNDQGIPTFGRFASVDPLSSDVFARRYQNNDEDEESYTASASPFSSSLNAITIR